MKAYTKSVGPPATIKINPNTQAVLPKIIVATTQMVLVHDVDSDQNKTIISGISTPIKIAYSMSEEKLYWLNDMQELFVYSIESGVKTKVLEMNGSGTSLAMDWVARILYYAEKGNEVEGSSVNKVDLNYFNRGVLYVKSIFKTSSMITKLEVSPFTR